MNSSIEKVWGEYYYGGKVSIFFRIDLPGLARPADHRPQGRPDPPQRDITKLRSSLEPGGAPARV